MTADEILDVLDKLHALRHVRAITPEEFAVRKAYLLGLLDGAIGLQATSVTTAEPPPATEGSDDAATSTAPTSAGGRRRAPGISPNVAVAMLLVVAAIVGVIAFTLGRSVPEPGADAARTAVVVSTTPTTAVPPNTDR